VANPPIFEIVGDPSPNPPISRRPWLLLLLLLMIYTVFRKDSHSCFLAKLVEKVTNLN